MEKVKIDKFLGIDYATQPRLLPPGAALKCNNIDISTGAIRTRRGAQVVLAAKGNRVYGLYERQWGSTLYSYQVVDDLVFRSDTQTGSGWARNDTYFASVDQWTFLTDGTNQGKDDGTTASLWGIAIPIIAPAVALGAAGNLTGTYNYKKTRYDSATGTESNPSPVSADVVPSSQQVALSNLVEVPAAGTQYTHNNLYRKSDSLTDWYFLVQLDKTTATYNDNITDANLGSVLTTDNAPPPQAKYVTGPQNLKLFMANTVANPNYLFVSKENLPGTFPTNNALHIGDAGMPIFPVAWQGVIVCFSPSTIWKVYGAAIELMSVQSTPVNRGTVSPRTVAVSPYGIFYLSYDGVYLFTGENSEKISTQLNPLFAEEQGYPEPSFPTQAVNSLSTAWGIFKDDLYWLCMPTEPGGYPTKAFVYHHPSQQWFTRPLSAYLGYASPYDNRLYFASFNGDIWGHPIGYNDAGVAISYNYLTSPMPVEDQTNRRFRHLRVDLDTQGQIVTINTYINGAKASAILSASAGRNWVEINLDRTGYYANIEFTGTSVAEVRIYGLELFHDPLRWV